ncbi:hypothetical protein [Ensifer canadensis]
MANGLQLLDAYNEPPKKPENAAVKAFVAYLANIQKATNAGKPGGRGNSSYKLVGDTYEVKLLGRSRYVPKGKIAGLVESLIKAAKDENDTAFRAEIEKHHAPAEEPNSGTGVGNG